MAEPLIEWQAQRILARLQTITTGAGYTLTPSEVIRPKGLQPAVLQHKQIMLLQAARQDSKNGAENRAEYTEPFPIILILRPSESDTIPIATYINRFAADVHKCLLSSESSWYTSGRVNYNLTGPVPLPEEIGEDGATMMLELEHRHDWGNPYADGADSLQVVSVVRQSATWARWTFNGNVSLNVCNDELKINGVGGSNHTQTFATAIDCAYASVVVGQAWSIGADVTGLTPNPVVGQSGLVT